MGGRPLQPQLHQQRAALGAGAPAGKVKGEVHGFAVGEGAGERVVAPGGEVGPGGGEARAEQGHGRGDRLGQLQRSGLIGRIHAVSPEQNPRMAET